MSFFAAAALLLCAVPQSALSAPAADPRCAIFGEGFSYVESIGSCVRIGGLVRADAGIGGGSRRGHGSSGANLGGGAQLGIEVDKDTELGPFRAVVIPRAGVFDNELR